MLKHSYIFSKSLQKHIKKMIKLTLAILLLLALTDYGRSRLISNIMISDGIYNATTAAAGAVPGLGATTVSCEPPYGFLPCTTELPGLIFLVVVYQYLLSLGQKYVSEGSDLFFQTFGPGVFGASLFHFIGTIPQIALILGMFSHLLILVVASVNTSLQYLISHIYKLANYD